VTVDTTRATEPGYATGGGRTYVRDPKGSDTGGQFTASPAPVTGSYQGYKASGAVSRGTGRKTGVAKAGPKAGLPASSRFKTLTADGDNDPAAVKEMQQLLTALGFGNINASGVYDQATQDAVKAVQARLGMKKPNGNANRGLVNKLLTAYDLSPCVNRG
jgi:Putative peptidoglycan binding domain